MFIHFFFFHMQKIPFFSSSVIENPATAGFSAVFQKTSANRSFGFLEKRQLSFPSTARTAGGSDRPGAAKAPGLSPAFPSTLALPAFCWGCPLNQSFHIPLHTAHNGVFGFGGAGSCPERWEGTKPAHRASHGALLCNPGSGEVLFHSAELPLMV